MRRMYSEGTVSILGGKRLLRFNPLFTYDLLLDSGRLTPEESADKVLNCLAQNKNPQGFIVSAQSWSGRDKF